MTSRATPSCSNTVLYLTSHADGPFEAKQQLWEDEAYPDKPFTRERFHDAIALRLFGRTTL